MTGRLLDAAGALVVGLLVYLGWRSGLELHRLPGAGALSAFGAAHPVPGWVKNSLPDALWQYAFTAVVLEVWRGEPWTARKAVFVGGPALAGVFIEGMQRAGLFAGTFDWTDVGLSLGASALALACHGRAGRSVRNLILATRRPE